MQLFPPKSSSDWANFLAIQLVFSYLLWNWDLLFWMCSIAWWGVMLVTSFLGCVAYEDALREAKRKKETVEKPGKLEALYGLPAHTIERLAAQLDAANDTSKYYAFLNKVENRLQRAWEDFSKENRKHFVYHGQQDTNVFSAIDKFKELQKDFNKTGALKVLDDILYEHLNAQRTEEK
jgi:hypothetical protein